MTFLENTAGFCSDDLWALRVVVNSAVSNTEHVQGLGANGKAAFSPKPHG